MSGKKTVVFHLFSVHSLHLALPTCEEINFESLKAIPFFIHEVELP